MAVTLEGVFRIIDRASPALRSIERQALKTDAAIASVGVSLDALGSNQQLKKLDATTRNVRTLGVESQTAAKRATGAAGSFDQMGSKVEQMGGKAERAARKLGSLMVLMKPVVWLGIGSAIGVVVQAVGALSGGVIALLPRISDLAGVAAPAVAGITGLGIAAIATKLAMNDLTKAYGGNKQALKSLTPEGRAFLVQLKQMRPFVKELRQAAQQGLFPGLGQALTRVRSTAGPTLQRVLRRGGQSVGGAASTAALNLTQPQRLADLDVLSAQGATIVRRGTNTLLSLLDVLRNFGVAARPFTDWMTTSIQGWAAHRAAISQFNRDSGKTGAFLERTKTALEGTVRIVTLLWGNLRILGQAARPLGDLLWKDAERGLKNWQMLHETVGGRTGLTAEFLRMEPAIVGIMRLVSHLGAAIFRMGTSSGLPKTVNALDKLVPALEKTLNFLADTFGPPLANALVSIANVATSLTGASGPFVLMVDLLSKTLNLISGITTAVPGMGKVIGIALDVFLISRFLVKIGLLQKGWMGVAFAARTAAAAEASAMGASAGGALAGAGRMGRVNGALSTIGFGFGSARKGRSLVGDFGPLAAAGSFLGRGRLGSTLSRAGRSLTPLGIGAAAAGLGLQFLPVSNRAKSIGSDVAMGAGIGAAAGSIFPVIGTGVGAGLGALAGGAIGLMRSRQDQLPGQVASTITTQLEGIHGYTSAIGKLTAEIAIFQSAQKRLAGDRSAAAQQELQSIQQEVSARRAVLAQLRAERQQRLDASRSKQAMNAATDLGHLFDFLTSKAGGSKTRAAALRQVNDTANERMMRLHGVARVALAQGIVRSNAQLSKGDPEAQKAAAAERRFIGQHVPGALAITDPARKVTGSLAEFRSLERDFMANRSTEAAKQKRASSRTQFQNAMYRWFVAYGIDPKSAAAMVMATDGTEVMPTTPAMRTGGKAATAKAERAAGIDPVVVRAAEAAQRRNNPLPPKKKRLFAAVDDILSGHAIGGRVPGVGLTDHVPLGAGAIGAPGELVVNRHQEAAADRGLGRHGALAALVAGMPVRHSDARMGGFASGGRLTGMSTSGVDPRLVGDLRALAAGIGTDVTVTSGYRSVAKQAELYEIYRRSGFDISHIAAKPGESAHNYGLAVDAVVNGSGIASLGSGILSRYGLVAPVGGDPVHAELLNDSPQLLGLSAALALAGRSAKGQGPAAIDAAGVAAGGGTRAAGAAATAVNPGLTALAFAGNPFASGHEALRAQAAAQIMGFIPLGPSGASRVTGSARAAKVARATSSAASAGAVTKGSNRAKGRAMMLSMGWGPSEWPSLDSLWTGESHWDETAVNPSSGAWGIPQSLPGSKMESSGEDWRTNAVTQMDWGLNYIKGRYGSPSEAYQEWLARSPHWYAGGGRLAYAGAFKDGGSFKTSGPTAFIAGEGANPKETVTVSKGHGGGSGHSFTIQNMTFEVNGETLGQDVQQAVAHALEAAWSEFERELQREATR